MPPIKNHIDHHISSDTDDDPPIYQSSSPLYTDDGNIQNERNKLLLHGSINKTDDNNTEISKCGKILKFVSSLTIETFMFLFSFSYMIKTTCSTNLMIEKACTINLNYSELVCSNLTQHKAEKDEVEKLVNDYNLYMSFIYVAPGALTMTFITPWSDKYGRKPPLVLALIGSLLDDIGVILNAIYYNAPVEYFLLSKIPSGLSGGFICALTICYSLASETTATESRTFKYALIQFANGMGTTLGILAGGLLYKYYSYIAVFAVGATSHMLAVLWVILFIEETRGLNRVVNLKEKICDLFSLANFVKGYKACTKVRENKGRCQIWMLLFSMGALLITYVSLGNINYIYAYLMFGWGPTKFSLVSTVVMGLSLCSVVLFVPLFTKVLKLQDAILGIIGTISMIANNVSYAMSYYPWIYYLGSSFGLLGGIAPLAITSRISKLVDKEDLGNVFLFLSSCEQLMPLFGTILVTKIYNFTLNYFPGMCYLVATVILVLPLGTFVWQAGMKPNN